MKAFVIAVVLLTFGSAPWEAERAGAQAFQWQVSDSCLTLYQNVFSGEWENPDSVMVDTCAPYGYSPYYAKKWFSVDFDSDIFHLPPVPADSILTVTLAEIDSNYPQLRSKFDSLAKRFGNFVLYKQAPQDTSSFIGGFYNFYFNSVQWIYGMTYGNLSDSGAIGDILGIENAVYLGFPVQSRVHEQTIAGSAVLWPDPAEMLLHLGSLANSISNVVIYNEQGERIREVPIIPASLEFDVSLVGLPVGHYFIQAGGEIFHFVLGP